jgi:urocanate hydratase
MGGAQPLAATMNGAAALVIEVDPQRIQRRVETRYLDESTTSLDVAVSTLAGWARAGEARSMGLLGNAADVLPALVARGVTPDVVTDQTSAHDALNGYVPNGLSLQAALALRERDPETYLAQSMRAMGEHVRAMLDLQHRGSIVFDYGNNIRAQAQQAGVGDAFDIPGFVPEYIRPLFCEGKARSAGQALSGDPADIAGDRPRGARSVPARRGAWRGGFRWPPSAWRIRGCPRASAGSGTASAPPSGRRINAMVRSGELKAPIVIGRDHLDTGSVASPNRETEGMRDGSDAIGDWPILNALLNTAAGATWVSVHHGGGVGIGYSLHAGMVIVADGSDEADARLERVLTCDPRPRRGPPRGCRVPRSH